MQIHEIAHTRMYANTHTHPDKLIITWSYVSFPRQCCVISNSCKMQMTLALLTQVQIWPSLPDLSPTGMSGGRLTILANSTSALDDLCSATAANCWQYLCCECAHGGKNSQFVPKQTQETGSSFCVSRQTQVKKKKKKGFPGKLHIIVCSKTNSCTS